ncbi:MAG: ABC transporter ATP-binding protein [Gemmatimonadetes bacterium]|nr:ABC transporter ATP-binding protein [Gemmatimonadota bacterium]
MADAASALHEEEALGKAYDARLMRRLLRYLRPHRGRVAVGVALLLTGALIELIGPWLTKVALDRAIPERDFGLLGWLAAAYFGALLLALALEYAESVLTTWLGQRVMYDLRREIFAHLQRLSLPYYDRNPVGRIMTRVTSDVEVLNELFSAGVVTVFGDVFTLVFIVVAMLLMDWKLALVTLAVMPLVALVAFAFRARIRDAYREIRVRLARINAFLQERITGMAVVQLFGREADTSARFRTIDRDYLGAHLRSITYYALFFPIIELLTAVALASIIAYGGAQILGGTLTVGVVAAFLQYARRFFRPIQDLSEKYNMLQGAMASSERIFKLLDTPISVPEPAQPLHLPTPGRGEIEFRDVWFAYRRRGEGEGLVPVRVPAPVPVPDRVLEAITETAAFPEPPAVAEGEPVEPVAAEVSGDGAGGPAAAGARAGGGTAAARGAVEVPGSGSGSASAAGADVDAGTGSGAGTGAGRTEQGDWDWVIRGLSFTARPGERLAIVGHTGAGKTTVVNLLMRFYQPQRGEILFDGVPIQRVPLEELRSRISLVLQDVFLFSRDVGYNIRLGREDIEQERVSRAARRVGAHRFIERLPQRYAEPLAERGASISVGERQLLSFARALAFDPLVLVLDEATSSVDSELEEQIERAVETLMRGRTSLVIAHRLSTVQNADRILVLHHGELREEGTHQGLLARAGIYARLYELQFVPSPVAGD